MWAVLQARFRASRARREEARLLTRLGEEVAAAQTALKGNVQIAAAEVGVHDDRLAQIDAEFEMSLRADRTDYTAVSAWVRPIVIARGFAVRSVLRHRRRVAWKERCAACQRLGVVALEGSVDYYGAAALLATRARVARGRADSAQAEAARLLEPFGGAILPPAAHRVVREVWELGKAAAKEFRGHVAPRVPALGGLAAGWWVANTFTDSHFSAMLHGLGLGSGPRRAVDSETLQALSFWLPILAAAVCSYAGNRISALIRSRYGAGQPSPTQLPVALSPPAQGAERSSESKA
jgi:hypothetical protein